MKIKYILLCLLFTIAANSVLAQYNASDWELRDEWMDVQRILDLAGIDEEDHVADIGCHEGYLSMHLAERVGARGRVYAVDVREHRLEKLNRHANNRSFFNITTILGDYDNPKLPANELDAVVIMDTYHEMSDYMEILRHVRTALKPSGKVLILEKLKSHARNKSRKDQIAAHTLSPKYVERELEEAGFKVISLIQDLGNWENDPTKKMWALVAIIPDA